MLQLHRRVPRRRAVGSFAAALTLGAMIVAVPAQAADSVPPAIDVATLSPAPDGNANWRRVKPVTLNLAATDDVAVAKFQYSLDAGATYTDVPITPATSVNAAVPITQEGNTALRYRAVDTSGNISPGVTANTTQSVVCGGCDRDPVGQHRWSRSR